MKRALQTYKMKLDEMWSNDSFTPIFGEDVQSKILLYKNLKQYKTILDVFPNGDDYKIILIEQEQRSGHWCSLMRVNDVIIWFDSLGCYPDDELNFVSKTKNRLLGQNRPEIQRLMKGIEKYGLTALYSKTKYQRNSTSTCGRWVAIAVKMLFEMKYTLPDMKRIFDRAKIETGKPYDIIIVDWT